jgi:hypothetical protein
MSTCAEQWVHAIKELNRIGVDALPLLPEIYAPDMRFIDPIQEVSNLNGFLELNRSMFRKTSFVRFNDVEVVEGPQRLVASWVMEIKPKLGPRMVIPGVSDMRLKDDLIVLHRDYWDLLGSTMDAFPGIRYLYRNMVKKLG